MATAPTGPGPAPAMREVSLESGGASSITSPRPAIDLEWQTFAPAPAPATASPPTAATPTHAAVPAEPAQPPPPSAAIPIVDPAIASPLSCITPSFYTHLFNVDTEDVIARLRHAAWPLQPTTFLQSFGAKPDLYGPLWLCATLVFVIGASANLAAWLTFSPTSSPAYGTAATGLWKYDFKLVTLALCVVFG